MSDGVSATLSDACLACEAVNPDGACKMRREVCAAFANRKATQGPKAGTLKTALCEDLFVCVAESGCSLPPSGNLEFPEDLRPGSCLCGADDPECLNMSGDFPGACADEVMAASESTMLIDVSQRLYDDSFAVGAVFNTVVCDAIRCARSCGHCDPDDEGCVDMDMVTAGTPSGDGTMSMMDGGV